MRLGQLARKLSLRPAQIVEFLAQHNVQMEESSNARIDDSHVELIVRHYAPEDLNRIVEEVEERETETKEVEIKQEQGEVEPVAIETDSEDDGKQDELPEVIRVPKIELSGLKVLGKIELPEPKKKEPVAEHTEEGDATSTPETLPVPLAAKPRNPNRKSAQNRERPQPRQWKNPLELQREREARAAEEKKQIAIEREKEKRRRHYEEKVKSVAQPKRAKSVKEQPEVKKKPVNTRPVPKTWLGKFLRWWTT